VWVGSVRQALLRQGREFAEVLVECPVVDHREALPDDAARNRRRRGAIRAALGPGAAQGAGGPATVARGVLVLRLINIGRAVRAPLYPIPFPARGSYSLTQLHRVVSREQHALSTALFVSPLDHNHLPRSETSLTYRLSTSVYLEKLARTQKALRRGS
jgi:hypothetical protein